MEANNYSSDAPISSKDDDRFSRWTFSERIAQVISKRSDPSSIVLGLYGVWGDGKTSVLNFIEEALIDDDNVICIKFNPWRFGSEEELLTGFFMNIAEALDTQLIKTGDKLKDILKKVAPSIGAAAGVKGVGESIVSFISGPDVVELKNRIEQELESAKKRVLILMDDIDRLEKSEIHAIFRLVKLTADFKYTSYILAFDKDIVAASLQEKYSSAINNAGEAFLEKIIQVPLHLPLVEKNVLREFCFKGVDEALSIAEIKLSDQQVQEFVRDFTSAFDDCLTTPRKAKLYGNTLLFSLPILKNEINPVDLMLIEGVRIFYPRLYEAIRDHKGYFTGAFNQSMHSNNDKEKESISKLIDVSIDSSNISDKEGCIELLKNMFPKLQSVYGNMSYGSDWYEKWNLGQRICSEDYFSRYFTYSIPKGDISDQAIIDIVEDCKNVTEELERDKNPLSECITSSNSEKLIKKLRHKAKIFSADESRSLAVAVSLQCRTYPNPETLYNWTVPFIQAAMLVSDLIQNLNVNDRVNLVCKCIDNAPDIDFKLEIFRWLKREEEDKPEKDAFTEEQISSIGGCLGKNVSKYLDSGIDITKENPQSTPTLLYTIKKYLGHKYLDDYLDGVLKKDTNTILRLLEIYTPTSWGMESGISHKSDFERDQYNSLTGVVNPDTILTAIEKVYSTMPIVGKEFPRDYEYKDREILLKQFIWLHEYVLNETENNHDKKA